MAVFFKLLLSADFPFLRNALMAGVLSSVLFGTIGAALTVRHITSLAGAISHAVLGGIGLALYLSAAGIIPGLPPIAGALVFAVIAALLIGIVSLKAQQREDTAINAIWAIGMSLGVLFMAKTPGYVDPSTWLFGNILLISTRDIILLAVLDIIVVVIARRFYAQIEAASFDEEYARVRGLRSNTLFLILLIISAAAIVLLQSFVGIVMVIAMLALPAGCSAAFARSLGSMMLLGCIFSCVFSVCGVAAGWIFDLPVGAMTVIVAGTMFLGISTFRSGRILWHKKRLFC